MNKNNENNLNKPRSNALADYYHPQKKGAIDWPSFEQMRKEIIGDVPETELKELWSVNYK